MGFVTFVFSLVVLGAVVKVLAVWQVVVLGSDSSFFVCKRQTDKKTDKCSQKHNLLVVFIININKISYKYVKDTHQVNILSRTQLWILPFSSGDEKLLVL